MTYPKNRWQIFVVGDVLHQSYNDFLSLLEKFLIVPLRVDQSQLVSILVVQTKPNDDVQDTVRPVY